jgi:UDPglucose 6-dehydrogenase
MGADVKEVAAGMGLDKRIGKMFLDAGVGYGGSCFSKDVSALHHMAISQDQQPQLLEAVMSINRARRHQVLSKLLELLGDDLSGRTIGLLGLAFKPNTDDMRDAPSITIANLLVEAGATVKGYDPVSMDVARQVMPQVSLCKDPYEVFEGSDAVVLVTEWNEFKQLDMIRARGSMRQAVIIDGRNVYDPAMMQEMGFGYRGFGRGYNGDTNFEAK